MSDVIEITIVAFENEEKRKDALNQRKKSKKLALTKKEPEKELELPEKDPPPKKKLDMTIKLETIPPMDEKE